MHPKRSFRLAIVMAFQVFLLIGLYVTLGAAVGGGVYYHNKSATRRRQQAVEAGWRYTWKGAVPAAPYEGVGTARTAGRNMWVEQLVRGQRDDRPFECFEVPAPDTAEAELPADAAVEETTVGLLDDGAVYTVCRFRAPFRSPGLWVHPRAPGEEWPNEPSFGKAFDAVFNVETQAPGFATAVLEDPVLSLLLENPWMHLHWNGHDIVLYGRGRADEVNDFVTISDTVAQVLSRVPELVFEEIKPPVPVAEAEEEALEIRS